MATIDTTIPVSEVNVDGVTMTLVASSGENKLAQVVDRTVTEINATDLQGATKIGNYMFSYCSNLVKVVIPDSVTSIGNYAFEQCRALTEIDLGNGVEEIGASAFSYAYLKTDVTLPNSVKKINNAVFTSGFSTGYKLYVPDSIIDYGQNVVSTSNALSTTYENGNYVGNVNNSYSVLVSQATAVSTQTISSACKCIGYEAFSKSKSILESIEFEEGCELKGISYNAFYNCTLLNNITIPDTVTYIGGYAFRGCTALTDITIPETVEYIGYSAFYDCKNITTINFNAINCADTTSNPTDQNSSYRVFYNVGIATDGVTVNFGENVTQIPPMLFHSNSASTRPKLTTVNISDSVKTIGNMAFFSLPNITTINFGVGVEKICWYAFAYCYGITGEVNLPAIKELEDQSFYNCTGITSVVLGENIENIKGTTFNGCTSLTEMTIKAKTPPVLANSNSLPYSTLTVVYIPTGTLDAYKTATNWYNVADILVEKDM